MQSDQSSRYARTLAADARRQATKDMTEFNANTVETFRNEFSNDFVVFNIFFEESDPEEGGKSWNFQRALGADGTVDSLGEDDDGV